jgi:hypothetical protein
MALDVDPMLESAISHGQNTDEPGLGFGGSMHYDETRRRLWALDSRGNVYALRLDLEKALAGNGRGG